MSPPLVPQVNHELHFVLCDFGKHGQAYVETDPGLADRRAVIHNFIAGEYNQRHGVQSCRGMGSRCFGINRSRDCKG
jgi:hypothetical protein